MQERLEPPGELALGPADEPAFVGEPLEGDVRDVRRAPDRRELLIVLDDTELLDEPVPGDRLDSAGVQPRVALEAQRRGLEADRPREQLGERLEEIALGLDELGALDGAGALGVAVVGEELHALLVDEQRRVRARQPGEVANVCRVGDEKRLLELGAQLLDPVVHERSASQASASWYPSGPRPRIRCAARSATTE